MAKYNGYKNWETYQVSLHIQNIQELYNDARQIIAESEGNDQEAAVRLRSYVEEYIETLQEPLNQGIAPLFGSLLYGAFGEVDWLEVVEGLAQ